MWFLRLLDAESTLRLAAAAACRLEAGTAELAVEEVDNWWRMCRAPRPPLGAEEGLRSFLA